MQEPSAHQKLHDRLRRLLLEPHGSLGGRIAPLQLADENRVSVTPVREVLFRLAGERLVELHPDGGFSQVVLDGPALADLYAWNGHLLLAALHLLPERTVSDVLATSRRATAPRHDDLVDALENLFEDIARATGNGEFALQVEVASRRLRRVRLVEDRLFPDTGRELNSMVRRVVSDAKSNVRRRIQAYHRRRVEHAGQIAALLLAR